MTPTRAATPARGRSAATAARASALLLLLAPLAACSRGPSASQRMNGCARAARAAAAAAPGARLGVLAHGCPVGCQPKVLTTLWRATVDEWPRLVEAACDVHCNPEERRFSADLSPAERLTHALEQCGPAHFGLTLEQSPAFSTEWIILERMGRWLAAHSSAGAAAVATASPSFPLALRAFAPGLYRVPATDRHQPPDAATGAYIFVDAERVRATAGPSARLTATGTQFVASPWGVFPGAVLYPAELPDRLLSIAMLAEPTRSDLEKVLLPAPLVIADGDLAAIRVVSILAAIATRTPGLRLAVAGPDGVLAQHPVLLRAADSGGLEVTVDEGSYSLSIRRPDGDNGADLGALLRWWVSHDDRDTDVSFLLRDDVTTTDLAELLDLAARAGLTRVGLGPAR